MTPMFNPAAKRAKQKLKYFRLIAWPNFVWYYLGGKLWYEAKSYWHLNVQGKNALWSDASQEGCKERYCMHCGKGKKHGVTLD